MIENHMQRFASENPFPKGIDHNYEKALLIELDNWGTKITDLAAAYIRLLISEINERNLRSDYLKTYIHIAGITPNDALNDITFNEAADILPEAWSKLNANEIDLLMQRMEEINHKDPPLDHSDITTLIANARRQRQLKSSGQKPSRSTTSLADILDIVRVPHDSEPKSESTFKRRQL